MQFWEHLRDQPLDVRRCLGDSLQVAEQSLVHEPCRLQLLGVPQDQLRRRKLLLFLLVDRDAQLLHFRVSIGVIRDFGWIWMHSQ